MTDDNLIGKVLDWNLHRVSDAEIHVRRDVAGKIMIVKVFYANGKISIEISGYGKTRLMLEEFEYLGIAVSKAENILLQTNAMFAE